MSGAPTPDEAAVPRRRLPVWLLYAAIFSNAALAVLNAHGAPIHAAAVTVAEAVILAAAALYLFPNLKAVGPLTPFAAFALLVFTTLFVWVSLTNASVNVKALGDIVIILFFYLLGALVEPARLVSAFCAITLAVVAGMVLEGWFLDSYAAIFQPALYYTNTRGIEAFSLDTSGVFRNSLGFAGRFTYGLFGERRLSSLFLEQVSLANFAMVLAIFTMCFWGRLKKTQRLFFVAAVVFMIVANSSRSGTVLCLMMAVGYWFFPRLPKNGFRLIMPVLLVLAAALFYRPGAGPHLSADDLKGRVGHTIALIAGMSGRDLLTGNAASVPATGDSGYAYLIYSQTLAGLVFFWFMLARLMPSRGAVGKRFAYGATLYLACNLLIGAAVLSIKVSAPLWFIAGNLAAQQVREKRLAGRHAASA